ncbi:MAG: hypothetical protein KatS3mg094_323 [Candidatus Parcubacteria bacterium]|nr:MAG: hypothetical protein KatS3mg094_323 [Candidatus Parcubacteria bacterium]
MEVIHSNNNNNNNVKDYLNELPKSQEEVGWFWGNGGVFILLIFALFVDVLGIIFGLIDLASIGIVGWILRIIGSLIYIAYLIWFWIESNKFDYSYYGARKLAKKNIEDIKNNAKKIIRIIRSILSVSIATKLIPIIGAIIDALPIETLSVVFLFYIYPKILAYKYNND